MTRTKDRQQPNGSSTTSSTTKVHAKIRASRTKSHFYVLFGLWLTWCSHFVVRHTQLRVPFCSCWLFAAALLILLQLSAQRVHTILGLTAYVVVSCLVIVQQSSALQAVSVAVGYLAFDHWFSALFAVHKSMGQQFEEAVTLSSFLVVFIELLRITANHNNSNNNDNNSADYLKAIGMWACFKLIRCVVSIRKGASLHSKKAIVKTASNDNNVWRIHGVAYNVSSFVDSHPGGKEAILLGRGRADCTALFQSYHPFVQRPHKVLQKYRIESPPPQQTTAVTTTYDDDDDDDAFYNVLVKAVRQTLEQDHDFDPVRDRAATPRRLVYYLFILTAVAIGSVAHCRGSILGSFFLAFPGWLIGALGHDAGHFAVSSRWPVVNDWAVWGISFLSNPIVWQHQHTFAHHSHTNSLDHDPDLHHFVDILRLHRGVKQQTVFRNQSNRLYVLFAYTLVIVGTCFFLPWQLIQDGSLYGMVEWTDRHRPWRTASMYLHLLCYTGIIAILPFFVHRTPFSALVAVIAHVATAGVLFATFSQIGHLNEASLDPDAFQKRRAHRRDLSLNASWAVQQIETSNNFCPDSAMWHLLSNGLNLQIEHHLFPGFNHCHLHLIQPTVQAVCEEYGVCYKSYGSWSEVMGATLDWLERLSVEPELAKSQ